MEIVCLSFDPHGMLVATGSMDNTAKLWDVETGQEIFTLAGHKAEIVSLHFNTDGDKLLTSSFDNTAKIWDVSSNVEETAVNIDLNDYLIQKRCILIA